MICPCCNSPIQTPPTVEALGQTGWSPIAGSVLRQLIAAYPGGVPMTDLIIEAYRGANEPDTAYHVVAITVSKLRKDLAAYGWTIPRNGHGGRGGVAFYKLRPIE